jgi:hypothetical protein
MNLSFLSNILRGVAFIPAVVHGVESIFGSQSGAEKKQAALSFVSSALNLGEAVTNRDVVDTEKFNEGLSQVIDGVVGCLNASVWAKTKA